MHVITRKRIQEAKKIFPESASALDGWYRIISKNKFGSFAELKALFNSVDKVGKFHVFDIGGNKVRLIAVIHFNRQRIYVRQILDHKNYDQEKWKKK
jgi:mRNA interferase HigB